MNSLFFYFVFYTCNDTKTFQNKQAHLCLCTEWLSAPSLETKSFTKKNAAVHRKRTPPRIGWCAARRGRTPPIAEKEVPALSERVKVWTRRNRRCSRPEFVSSWGFRSSPGQMAPLFKGGFLVLFVCLPAVSEAIRSASRCVRETNFDSTGAAVMQSGEAKTRVLLLLKVNPLEQ